MPYTPLEPPHSLLPVRASSAKFRVDKCCVNCCAATHGGALSLAVLASSHVLTVTLRLLGLLLSVSQPEAANALYRPSAWRQERGGHWHFPSIEAAPSRTSSQRCSALACFSSASFPLKLASISCDGCVKPEWRKARMQSKHSLATSYTANRK